ncbi:hypothetical protein, partial [Parabacteroides johnsonii]|uniref:hypothetical protein n=1 Tax=Parabacteroides johnsonii TaxID=387661 RepID=UPI002672F2F6
CFFVTFLYTFFVDLVGQFLNLCIHFYIFFKLFPVEAVREPSVLNAYKVILFFELASSLS